MSEEDGTDAVKRGSKLIYIHLVFKLVLSLAVDVVTDAELLLNRVRGVESNNAAV